MTDVAAPGRSTWDLDSVLVLITPLSELYPTVEDSMVVVRDAGLERGLIEWSRKARTLWYEILTEASRTPGAVDEIIRIATERAPDNPGLSTAIRLARAAVGRHLVELAERPAQATAHAVARRRLDLPPEHPLIDRLGEVGRLRTRLEGTLRDRTGRAVLLRGDSGVGKSRLAERTVRVADEAGMIVLQAQCIDRRADALHPIRAALTTYRGGRSVPELLGEAGGRLDHLVPFVESFLRVGPAGAAEVPIGGSSGYGTADGLAQVLVGLADGPGLCLVVEDLTDADHDTLGFLEYLARTARPSPLLAVMTAKEDFVELDPELRDRFRKWAADGCEVDQVAPLEREHAIELVALAWNGQLPDGLAERVHGLTGGNPFFIEQVVALVRERPDPAAALDSVPDRVEAVVMRRFERLPEDMRTFLQAASIALDVTHRLELVAHLARLDEDAAADRFDEAVRLRLLTEDPQGGVAFVQEVVRRAVYDGVGPATRRRLHARAAEWLEAAGLPGSAAPHFQRADRPEDTVRAALAGAERAEREGTYPSAAALYRLAGEAGGDAAAIDLALARVHLVLGEWDEAGQVLDRLPPDLGPARVLRSDLLFVRGAFDRALREMRLALQAPTVDQVEALIRIGDIHLYLGRLAEAREYGQQAGELARTPAQVARAKGVAGAAEYHMGDIAAAEQTFLDAATVLSAQPIEERDRFVWTTALGNLGLAREARGDWPAAAQYHEESLRIRAQVSAAREVLHSRHALVRCAIGRGAFEEAQTRLAEARAGAIALREGLELGKLDHTEARIELRTGGDAHRAVRLIEGALERFRDLGVVYDTTHATFSLAEALAAAGARRRAIEEAAAAREAAERGRFGLLALGFPGLAFSYRERVEAGLLAYAAGDAVGLPWEGRPAGEIAADRLPSLHATETWPAGSTSDDTALTLLVAEHLAAAGEADGRAFLTLLAERAPGIPGLGPSTTAAIEHFRRTGGPPEGGGNTHEGNTNGALMRSLPVGWALPIDRVEDRRAWAVALSRATHPGAEACCAAAVGAACAAWALEGAGPDLLLEIARDEAAAMASSLGADPRIVELLGAIAGGTWRPDPGAEHLDPYETLARALWCVATGASLPDALLAAVRLGGDTDTVAALVGGLRGCALALGTVRAELPWLDDVRLPPADVLATSAAGLAALRVRRPAG